MLESGIFSGVAQHLVTVFLCVVYIHVSHFPTLISHYGQSWIDETLVWSYTQAALTLVYLCHQTLINPACVFLPQLSCCLIVSPPLDALYLCQQFGKCRA